MTDKFNWDTGFVLDFDLKTGFSENAKITKRHLSQMRGMFHDEKAYQERIMQGDPLVYEFYELGCPERAGDIAFGTTILYPGTVGDEYFMTKGHFHTDLMTAEIYYTLSGTGYMMLESKEGDWRALPLAAGQAVYVPRGYRKKHTGALAAPRCGRLHSGRCTANRLRTYGGRACRGFSPFRYYSNCEHRLSCAAVLSF